MARATELQPAERIVTKKPGKLSEIAVWLQLVRNLAVRDVEIRYKHSLLGLYWAIINPLITAVVFSFVFGVVFKSPSPIKAPYVVFLLSGLTFWNFFANGVSSAATSITGSASLLAKVYFPRVVLPTASILARLIDLCFSLVVLGVFLAIYRVPVHWTVIALPLILILEFCFTLGIGFLVAALNVLYRDVNQIVGLLLMVWLYLSPVMYAASVFAGHGKLTEIMYLNPLGSFIQAERDLIFTGHLTQAPYLWIASASTLGILLLGLAIFKRVEPLFAEVM